MALAELPDAVKTGFGRRVEPSPSGAFHVVDRAEEDGAGWFPSSRMFELKPTGAQARRFIDGAIVANDIAN